MAAPVSSESGAGVGLPESSRAAALTPRHVPASHSAIVRAAQKDDYYIDALNSELFDVSTAVFGKSTLGEEYCDIVQLDSSCRRPPSVTQRALLCLLDTLGPLAGAAILRNLARQEHHRSSRRGLLRLLGELGTRTAEIRRLGALFARLHVCWFYFTGAFASLAKRATGTRLGLFTTPRGAAGRRLSQSHGSLYALLGALFAVQVAVEVSSLLRRAYRAMYAKRHLSQSKGHSVSGLTEDEADALLDEDFSDGAEDEGARRCQLCLETWTVPSALPCGHVFCWECAMTWLAGEKSECPLCRQPSDPGDLIPLWNV